MEARFGGSLRLPGAAIFAKNPSRPGKMCLVMFHRQTKRSLLLLVLAALTSAHAQYEVPNEIFRRTLLIRSGDEQATALKFDQGGRIYLVTTRRLGGRLPLDHAVVQVWQDQTWSDLQTVRTILPAAKDVDLAILETDEQIAKPYSVVKSSEVLTTGQPVWIMGSFGAIKQQHLPANSQKIPHTATEIAPFLQIGTLSAIHPTRPDSFEIHFHGTWNLLIAAGPIVYWSPVHKDYEILGVIKRNERDAVNIPFPSNPPQKVVQSGIVEGYGIDVVVDTIKGNPHL